MNPPYIGPPPRHLRLRNTTSWTGPRVARLIILIPTICGAGFILYCLLKVTLSLIGTPTDGTIAKKYVTHGRKGGIVYHIDYTFTVDGHTYTPSSPVDEETFETLKPEDHVPVRYLSYLPEYTSDFIPPGHTFPPNLPMLALGALIFNAFNSIFIYLAYIEPWRRKQLIIHGHEADGNIIDKAIMDRKSAPYQVNYHYTALGQLHHASQNVLPDLFETLNPGDPLKVLYNPANPKRHTALELSDWEII